MKVHDYITVVLNYCEDFKQQFKSIVVLKTIVYLLPITTLIYTIPTKLWSNL